MPYRTSTSLIVGLLSVTAGCTDIPGADAAFLERDIPVGLDATVARSLVERRGFEPAELLRFLQSRYDEATRSFEQLPLTERQFANQNIGVVQLDGDPQGRLVCFERSYALLIASGNRLICWTEDEDNRITWKQAGFRGGML